MTLTSEEIRKGLERLERQFMQPDIVGPCDVWEVSANHGESHYVPASIVGHAGDLADYVEGEIDRDDDGTAIATLHEGKYIARLSAPGYMDCTDWAMFDTQEEADAYLVETYDDGEEEEEEDN